ncbi:MAG: FeoB-associated Cys-rich membrane protein [Flavobacteriaceae bacterium]|nr:FeoB-associated Cys-rich membrane protein [Flavobacteriaceae bacterium]
MNIYIQYAFIAVTLIVAVGYIIKLFKDTFYSGKKNCDGGTSCKCGKDQILK